MAGTVGGVGGNGRGVAGVAWAVKMMSAKFLDGSTGSGSLYNAVRAVDYITQLVRQLLIEAGWQGFVGLPVARRARPPAGRSCSNAPTAACPRPPARPTNHRRSCTA